MFAEERFEVLYDEMLAVERYKRLAEGVGMGLNLGMEDQIDQMDQDMESVVLKGHHGLLTK